MSYKYRPIPQNILRKCPQCGQLLSNRAVRHEDGLSVYRYECGSRVNTLNPLPFDLNRPPRSGGWVNADFQGGWTCCIEQGWFDHPARKATWLYYMGSSPPKSLPRGKAPGEFAKIDISAHSTKERRRAIKIGICQQLSGRQRKITPLAFRDVLIELAEGAAP